MTIESLKKYIQDEIATRGFDENGSIRIDFADLGTEEETKQAVADLGYVAEPAKGQGVWKVSDARSTFDTLVSKLANIELQLDKEHPREMFDSEADYMLQDVRKNTYLDWIAYHAETELTLEEQQQIQFAVEKAVREEVEK